MVAPHVKRAPTRRKPTPLGILLHHSKAGSFDTGNQPGTTTLPKSMDPTSDNLPPVPPRYGEPDWDAPPVAERRWNMESEIKQQLLSDMSYEELRIQHEWEIETQKLARQNFWTLASGPKLDIANLTSFVTVVVGSAERQAEWSTERIVTDSETKFVIHESLVTSESTLIRTALQGGYSESQSRIFRLPEESPAAFTEFVRFLYTGSGGIWTTRLSLLLQCYILSDHLQAEKFQQAVLLAIRLTSSHLSAEDIAFVMDNTLPHDLLRLEVLQQVGFGIVKGVYTFRTRSDRDILEEHMPELMQGVIRAVAVNNGEFWRGSENEEGFRGQAMAERAELQRKRSEWWDQMKQDGKWWWENRPWAAGKEGIKERMREKEYRRRLRNGEIPQETIAQNTTNSLDEAPAVNEALPMRTRTNGNSDSPAGDDDDQSASTGIEAVAAGRQAPAQSSNGPSPTNDSLSALLTSSDATFSTPAAASIDSTQSAVSDSEVSASKAANLSQRDSRFGTANGYVFPANLASFINSSWEPFTRITTDFPAGNSAIDRDSTAAKQAEHHENQDHNKTVLPQKPEAQLDGIIAAATARAAVDRAEESTQEGTASQQDDPASEDTSTRESGLPRWR